MTESPRPVTVLIAAMGGEGGAVLMNWIVAAATACGLPVQSTSVPGVAQRTGATTYYIEMFPVPLEELGGRRPVLSLYPGVGDIDVLVASELIEVARAMERGFVSPDRTTLIGCTHRFYSVAEKMHGTDGRYDSQRVLEAAPQLACRAILFDGQDVARQAGSVVNAVLLGAVAGTGLLPVSAADLQQAIRTVGKAVDSNLAGFAAGIEVARGAVDAVDVHPPAPARAPAPGLARAPAAAPAPAGAVVPAPAPAPSPSAAAAAPVPSDSGGGRQDELLEGLVAAMPEAARAILREGARRLIEYQDARYAQLYLRRMASIWALDDEREQAELTQHTGRYLALWMSYEDVIRVAQLKTRPGRMARVRADTGAETHQIVRVTEYLKPGIEELCALLPPMLARPILKWAAKNRRMERLHFGVRVKSTTISGFGKLWFMARLRPFRRLGYRYQQEQTMIEGWLDLVRRAAALDGRMAVEVAACARLVRGYADTRRTGVEHYRRIVGDLVEPALAEGKDSNRAREAIAAAREAALAEPEIP